MTKYQVKYEKRNGGWGRKFVVAASRFDAMLFVANMKGLGIGMIWNAVPVKTK